MRRLLLILLALLPLSCPAQIPVASAGVPSITNCPTGQPCGANAPYCQNYTPPSTSGAMAITAAPAVIKASSGASCPSGYTCYFNASGNYYTPNPLTSTGHLIVILQQGPVDINLDGQSHTYGTTPNGSGSTQIGEYGILGCDSGNTNSEGLDSSFATNGLCANSGHAPANVTIENGSITQSTNASSYYDPLNCPGSGVGCPHLVSYPGIASHVINLNQTNGYTVKHVTLTWQQVDSMGIKMYNIQSGGAIDIECNTLNNEVTQLNDRQDEPRGESIDTGGSGGATSGGTIQYNSLIGTVQQGIYPGGMPSLTIQYNEIYSGYYQAPPFTTFLHAYSNDYDVGSIEGNNEIIRYNYVHGTNGRGIGFIYDQDVQSGLIYGNYVSTGEQNTNGEYGPNGTTSGASWPNPSGCEIDGGRAFEAKGTVSLSVYSNTLIQNVSLCGAVGIDFTEYPCIDVSCPTPANASFNYHDNVIQINNVSGASTLFAPQDVACYSFDEVEGNTSNYFAPFLRESCTSDGDFVNSDPYSGANYQSWYSPTWKIGSHPLSSGCGNTTSRTCGHMVHWENQDGTDPPNELGYVIQDVSFANGATASYSGEPADSGITLTARGSTNQWSYTVTLTGAVSGNPISGAVITGSDSLGGYTPTCTTNSSGQCTIVLRQNTVTSPAGSSTLTTNNANPNTLSFNFSGASPSGCSLSNQNVTITATASHTYNPAGC